MRSKNSNAESARKRGFPLGWTVAVLAVAAAGATVMAVSDLGSSEPSEYTTIPVVREDLTISVLESGTLNAMNTTDIVCQVEGRSVLKEILVKDGQVVEKGQLLATLDVSEFDERIRKQKSVVTSAKSASSRAETDLATQRLTNDDQIAKAKLELALAEKALERYEEGYFKQEETRIKAKIELASEELTRAETRYEWSQKLAQKEFITQNELEADRISVKKTQTDVDLATLELKVLREFDQDAEKQKLQGDIDSANRNLAKAKLTAEAEEKAKVEQVANAIETLKIEEDTLQKYLDMQQFGEIRATAAGVLIFGSSEGGRSFRRDEPIQEGVEVRERQKLFMIPDTSVMVADTFIQESMHNRVYRLAQLAKSENRKVAARVSIDALGGATFDGLIESVASQHDKSSSWMNPDRKVFPAQVRLVSGARSNELRPGMTCSVEIIIQVIEDALQVPVQAVRTIEGDNYCMVFRNGELEKVPVKVGPDNGLYVQILEGLNEGDEVQVSRAALAVGKTLATSNQQQPVSNGQPNENGGPASTEPSPGEGRRGRGSRGQGDPSMDSSNPGGDPEGTPGNGGSRGGRRGGGMSSMLEKLKEVATPEDVAEFEAAMAERDFQKLGPILEKYGLRTGRGGSGGGRGRRGQSENGGGEGN